MHKLQAIATLIRLPNLVFIFLTQLLAYFFMIKPALIEQQIVPVLRIELLIIFIASTILIATAGYIINDYFDLGIDAINKPNRVTIEKVFKRRSIIKWHVALNLIAILASGYIAFYYIQFRYIGFQLISIFLLIVYSTTFKRKLIIGNFIIAFLTSFTLISLACYEPLFHLFQFKGVYVNIYWLYISFAFMITFIREIIKDIEDIKGDGLQNCRTIPLVWGINIAKLFVFTFIFLLLALLGLVFYYASSLSDNIFLYLFIMVFIPLIAISYKLFKATNSYHFHQVSSYIKWITLAGILSMIFLH